jgi:hypothetical protein
MRGTIFCPFFVFIVMDYQDIIDDFNEGGLEAESVFGDVNTFLTFLDRRDLLDRIDIENTDIQNTLLIWLYKRDKKRFYQFVEDKLSDVYVDENNVVYLDLDDKSDLVNFFCDRSRNGLSTDYIKAVLSGESDEFWFDETTYSVYRDVIEGLNPKNMKYLREYVVETLKGQKIETETIELADIAREQGHPEYVIVDNPITAQTIIDDKDSMKYLLETHLQELNDQLLSIHRNAYSSAYDSELYRNIFSELQEYIDGNGEFYSRPHRFKKDVSTQRYRVPVASNFDQIILDYLDSNKERGYRGLLEYWGEYIALVQDEQNCLTVHPSEYPDHREVENTVNEIFTDYL